MKKTRVIPGMFAMNSGSDRCEYLPQVIRRSAVLLLAVLMLLPLLVPQVVGAATRTGFEWERNGTLEVSVLEDGSWREVGSLSFGRFITEGRIDLSGVSLSGGVTLRITHTGTTAAHVDSVFLGGTVPSLVSGTAEDESLALKKLLATDLDVIDVSSRRIEMTFVGLPKDQELSIACRVEPERLSTIPFRFPLDNILKPMDTQWKYYTYVLGSNPGGLDVDGDLATENLGKPFFREFSQPGTGHPADFTFGWIRNDGKNIYVALDFVPDNTMDGEKDYAAVYFWGTEGVKEFRVSALERSWGAPGFVYTDRADYQHKVYEFSIPLDEVGLSQPGSKDAVDVAFAAYGTAALTLDFGDAPDPTYPTLLANNGARHTVGSGLFLGAAVDPEPDGLPNAAATGDDVDGIDDEDGVVFMSTIDPGTTASVDITASTAGALLDAWIDFNADGDWSDAGEQIFTNESLAAGVNSLTFNVPAGANPLTTTFARFRISTAGNLSPTGAAVDGEVEDYQITTAPVELFSFTVE
jgi:hypothetical protein